METKKIEENKAVEFIRKNWFILLTVTAAIFSTWLSIKGHLSDDSLHVGKNKKTLTEDEYKNLIKFVTIINEKQDIIDENAKQIVKINMIIYGNDIKYDIMFRELEGLESKVSKGFSEINNKINK